ncbi:MAG: MMPL family transporter [Polyangiaceae bacterium]|nr:MMPL family transporter [Polyangiaceae bacterium]
MNPASFHRGITYGFAGDLQTGISEYQAINNDLTEVGFTGALLITAVVFAYYLRFRTLFTMVITVGIGVAWTFGITQLVIGHLNMATGFLFTIVAGNGINFGIIYMARYLEVRRQGEGVARALRIAQKDTWLPTLTASLAAGAAYGSLLVTEFRGFRDFGLIGGVGMVLCWVATFWTLPSILAVIERIAPLDRESKGPIARLRKITQGGAAFGAPFAALAPRAPRLIVVLGVGLAVVGSVLTVFYVKADPMEYDLKNLRTDPTARAEQIRLTKLAEDITGHVGADGMAILVDRPEQVEPLRAALYAKRDAAPPDAKPFKEVHALQDFVPKDQEAKIPILLEIKDKVMRSKKRGVIDDKAWEKIQPVIPPDDLKPFGIDDLPADVARAFSESDGTRGRIVYISPISPESVDDAHYLFRWADSYRETKLPDESVIRGSGRAVIYADMWAAIISDVPPSIIASLGATLLVVIIAFRAGRAAAAVLIALLIGIAWMAGSLVLMRVKLNFLNFIALPLTFGIGVDYAVNIVQRFVREGAGGALTAVRETGGAVILCSLTTMLGYLALVGSENFAVRSMGVAAVIGEVACLLAAVLVLPAGLLWIDGRRAMKEGEERVSVLR